MSEFLAIDRRISLEGMGLSGFTLAVPQGWSPPKALQSGKWNLSPREVLTLFRVLLDSIRTRGPSLSLSKFSRRTNFSSRATGSSFSAPTSRYLIRAS